MRFTTHLTWQSPGRPAASAASISGSSMGSASGTLASAPQGQIVGDAKLVGGIARL